MKSNWPLNEAFETDAETSVRDAKEINERINKNIEAHLVRPRPGRADMNMP